MVWVVEIELAFPFPFPRYTFLVFGFAPLFLFARRALEVNGRKVHARFTFPTFPFTAKAAQMFAFFGRSDPSDIQDGNPAKSGITQNQA